MECKSCGSIKFKQIKPSLFECEYCGRQVGDKYDDALNDFTSSPHLEDAMNRLVLDCMEPGIITYDPVKTMWVEPSFQYAEKINDCQDKLQDLANRNKKLKKDCLSIRKAIKRMIES